MSRSLEVPSLVAAIVLLLLGMLLLPGCSMAEPGPPPTNLDELVAQQAGSLVENKKAVGLAVAVIDEGETHRYFFGEAARGTGKAPDAATQFEIGSVTKTLTCAVLAWLVAEGELTLDTPVAELLPGGTVVPSYNGQPITLDHLATHTSGLPRLPDNLNLAGNLSDPYANYTREDLYAFLAGHTLRRAPGTQYEYSNFGTALLGEALAEHTGLPYHQLVDERLFTPLGMNDAVLSLAEADRTRLAGPHEAAFFAFLGQAPRAGNNWNLGVFAPAGGLIATLDDMEAYLRANMNPAGTVLADAADLLHTARANLGNGGQIALGWHILPLGDGREVVWHNGATGGYSSFVGFVRGTQTGIVLLSNTQVSADTDRAALGILGGIDDLP